MAKTDRPDEPFRPGNFVGSKPARWSAAEAKANLSEILRLAGAGKPQTIGSKEACVVVSAAQFSQFWQPEHLGEFLIASAPRGCELELPSRSDDR